MVVKYRLCTVVASALLLVASGANAGAGHNQAKEVKHDEVTVQKHDEHNELAEPFFTKKSIPENEIEFEFGYGHGDSENELEFGVGASMVFGENFQLGIEIPYVVVDHDDGEDVSSIGDIEFSAKYLVYRAPENRFILSFDAEVAAPTGDEDKEIGETGEWGLFTTAAFAIPMGDGLSDLGVHLQFGWEQQIRTTAEQREEAEELGVNDALEKAIIYRLALNTKLFDGQFQPSIEFLGTTIVDAIEESEKGTIFEIGGGFWWLPYVGTNSGLAPLALGVAAKAPVTRMQGESNYSLLFVLKYEFE